MNTIGEFRLCSSCGEWAIWVPQHSKGPVYCCRACARGRRCTCAEGPDGWATFAEIRPDNHQARGLTRNRWIFPRAPHARNA